MNRGKDICEALKAVRRRIAEENDIRLETPECTHRGSCRGSCPRCESEVRQLEDALANRLRLGKVATVAGLTLGLSLCANAQSEVPVIDIGMPVDTSHQVASKGVLMAGLVRERTGVNIMDAVPGEKQVELPGTPASESGNTTTPRIEMIKPVPDNVSSLPGAVDNSYPVERDRPMQATRPKHKLIVVEH